MGPMNSPVQVTVIPSRFDYVQYDAQSANIQNSIKYAFQQAEEAVGALAEGRAKNLILTHLEIAYMWSGKQIRDEQIKRIGSDDEPRRSNQ